MCAPFNMCIENTFDRDIFQCRPLHETHGLLLGNFSADWQRVRTQIKDQTVCNEQRNTTCKSWYLSWPSTICFYKVIRGASLWLCVPRCSTKAVVSSLFGLKHKQQTNGAGEMVPSVECLTWVHKDLSLISRSHVKQIGIIVHTRNPSTRKSETGEYLELTVQSV